MIIETGSFERAKHLLDRIPTAVCQVKLWEQRVIYRATIDTVTGALRIRLQERLDGYEPLWQRKLTHREQRAAKKRKRMLEKNWRTAEQVLQERPEELSLTDATYMMCAAMSLTGEFHG